MSDSSSLESLFVRLYFDRHIMTRLAIDLRERGYDVLTTEEARHDTAADEQQLAFAAGQGRAILSFNIRDFAPLHQSWQKAGRGHAGIIVSRQMGRRQYGQFLQRMLRLLNHFTADDLRENFIHLEQFR